jgi:stage II sporulation protein AA (anti-sigma F factor antagonist)
MINLDVETSNGGKSALVRLRGDFDLEVAESVAVKLAEVESTGPELLVLDLSGLSFLDSSGMGVIAAAHTRAETADRRFVVVDPPYGVKRAFSISKLDEVITIVEDLASVYP